MKATFIRILFELKVICPLGYFDIVIHLVLHLPMNIFADPVCIRWMYYLANYMKKLKNYVINKEWLEGYIADGWVTKESLQFCSIYLEDVET